MESQEKLTLLDMRSDGPQRLNIMMYKICKALDYLGLHCCLGLQLFRIILSAATTKVLRGPHRPHVD